MPEFERFLSLVVRGSDGSLQICPRVMSQEDYVLVQFLLRRLVIVGLAEELSVPLLRFADPNLAKITKPGNFVVVVNTQDDDEGQKAEVQIPSTGSRMRHWIALSSSVTINEASIIKQIHDKGIEIYLDRIIYASAAQRARIESRKALFFPHSEILIAKEAITSIQRNKAKPFFWDITFHHQGEPFFSETPVQITLPVPTLMEGKLLGLREELKVGN